jgi:TonB family protein
LIETVTDIIVSRSREPEGLSSMIMWSVVAHVGLVVFVLFMPASWRGNVNEPPKTVMTISLGGAPGPRAGGMTPMGGRAIQAPLPASPIRQAMTAPAPKAPEMALPTKNARTSPPPKPQSSPKEATGRAVSIGPEVREGSARAETGARGQGFGLTTGGGAGTGAYLDVGDFCCPDYLETIVQMVQRNWDSKQNAAGQTVMKFTIQRNGVVTDVQVERPSGFVALDTAAQRALLLTQNVPGLPSQFPNQSLTVHLRFEYQR